MNSLLLGLILVVAALNLACFILVGLDKKRSISKDDRVPEVYFFFLASCFASLGVLLGMYAFRHKTKKFYFPFGVGLLLLQQVVLVILVFRYFTT